MSTISRDKKRKSYLLVYIFSSFAMFYSLCSFLRDVLAPYLFYELVVILVFQSYRSSDVAA